MNLYSKYLNHQRNESNFTDWFQKIENKELKTKNTELFLQINSATIKISSYFENCIRKFPSLFNMSFKTFEECLIHLDKCSIPNKCVCASVVDTIPGWHCVECSKYENSIYCNDCYIKSKDLHKGHKILYLNNLKGMCDCGDPDSLHTYCHEHSGPFIEQKEIDYYIQKSLGKELVENLKQFFEEFFSEFSKYFILTEKCDLFTEEVFNEKLDCDLTEELKNEKLDVMFLKSNFNIIFQNLICFLRLITTNNLAMIHLISFYFLKNHFTSSKLEEEYKTDHICIEINQNDIKVYNDAKEKHNCKCPFLRLFLTNYRNSIKLNSEEDEKELLFSFVHNLSLRNAFCILFFFLYEQILYNANSNIMNCRTQFYLEDVIELISKKTSFIEDSVNIFHKYIKKLLTNKNNKGKLRKDAIMRIVILIGLLQEDIKYYSRPKIKLLLMEKTAYFKKFFDIICFFHNIYKYISIVPHPEFQDKPVNEFLLSIDKFLTKIGGLLICSFDWNKMELLKQIYGYMINKILNQEKEGIKQLKDNEFSFYIILYRIFGIFLNGFCFNYSFINKCTIMESLNYFKSNFFESKEQVEIFVDIIIKDYCKFIGFIYGTKNNFFNYYDRANIYHGLYTEFNVYYIDLTLLKYLFALTEKGININSLLKLSNIENVYNKFDQIFNLGIILNNNQIKEQSDENEEIMKEINENILINLENLSEEEKQHFILRYIINKKYNKSDKIKDEFNIIMQWKNLIEFLIFILKEDSCCYNILINNYNETLSSKTKSDLFNNIKNNKYVMEDLNNILKEKIIHNMISQGNLVDKQKLEKKMNEYLLTIFEENNIFNQTLEELTHSKMNGDTKMFYLKDEYLKNLDFNYYINPKDKSSAQKYILDFKKDKVKIYNYHFNQPSILSFDFFEAVYEKVFLNKNNLELIIRIIDGLLNNYNLSEYLDKESIRNSFLPVILNFLQIFNVINTKSFIEFKIENKPMINKLYELLINFIKNNGKSNIMDKNLVDNIKEVLNRINNYQMIFENYDGDLSKLNKYDYNINILNELKINEKLENNNNITSIDTDGFNEKKQKSKKMKEKLKNLMQKKSTNFLNKINSNEEMIKIVNTKVNDIENMNNDKHDEIMCFYCRNPIQLNKYEKPYGKLGLCVKDLFYANSIKATFRDEFSKLEINDNEVYSKAMNMIYNQGFFRILSCGHYFHNSCFIEGCEKGDKVGFNCPLCLKYQNILIPPLSLFHDKYSFLKSEKINEIFKENNELDKNKETNEGIDLFEKYVIDFLITINIYKKEIKNYSSFIDNMYPYYKAILNNFENVFYVDSSSFHKQQQIDNIKNLILSLRLIFHDPKNCDKYVIAKYIKETIFQLIKCPEENKFIYKYYDSYLHYLNIFEKIILSLLILFDYEEMKETFKYIIYLFLPYICFGLYFKKLIIEKQKNKLSEELIIEKLNFDKFNKHLKEDNLYFIEYFNSFLKKFCLIKLISDFQNKNENIINNYNDLSTENLLSLLNMDDLKINLSSNEVLMSDIINILPKTFNSSEVFHKLFSQILNFNNTLNSIIENVKKYHNSNKNIKYDITQELLIQFSPVKFNFIHLDDNIFDLIEKNIGKKCIICGKMPKQSFLCLICGSKICYTGQIAIRIEEAIAHSRKCCGNYCLYIDLENMRIYYMDAYEKVLKLYPIYVNNMGIGPKGEYISNEFNLSHEKLKLLKKIYISKDFHFK